MLMSVRSSNYEHVGTSASSRKIVNASIKKCNDIDKRLRYMLHCSNSELFHKITRLMEFTIWKVTWCAGNPDIDTNGLFLAYCPTASKMRVLNLCFSIQHGFIPLHLNKFWPVCHRLKFANMDSLWPTLQYVEKHFSWVIMKLPILTEEKLNHSCNQVLYYAVMYLIRDNLAYMTKLLISRSNISAFKMLFGRVSNIQQLKTDKLQTMTSIRCKPQKITALKTVAWSHTQVLQTFFIMFDPLIKENVKLKWTLLN